MKYLKRMAIILCLIVSSLGCDQSTKYFATQHLQSQQTLSFAKGMLQFQYAENPGAFLGLGSGLSDKQRFVTFTVLVALFLCALFFYALLNSKQHLINVAGLSLIMGGGLSNLIDRAMNNGVVVDFINVDIGILRTGIFNVADMLILSGICILLFYPNKKSAKLRNIQ